MVVCNEDSIDKEGKLCTAMLVEVGCAKVRQARMGRQLEAMLGTLLIYSNLYFYSYASYRSELERIQKFETTSLLATSILRISSQGLIEQYKVLTKQLLVYTEQISKQRLLFRKKKKRRTNLYRIQRKIRLLLKSS